MTPTTYRDPGPGCATPAVAIIGIGLVFAALAAAGVALASREAEASPPPVPAVQVCYATADGQSRCSDLADLPPASTADRDRRAMARANGAAAGEWVGEVYLSPTTPTDPPP